MNNWPWHEDLHPTSSFGPGWLFLRGASASDRSTPQKHSGCGEKRQKHDTLLSFVCWLVSQANQSKNLITTESVPQENANQPKQKKHIGAILGLGTQLRPQGCRFCGCSLEGVVRENGGQGLVLRATTFPLGLPGFLLSDLGFAMGFALVSWVSLWFFRGLPWVFHGFPIGFLHFPRVSGLHQLGPPDLRG